MLHIHFEGSVSLGTLRNIAVRKGRTLPDNATYSFRNFTEFNAIFPKIFEPLTEEQDFYELAAAFAEDLARQNVTYCEAFYVPLAHVRRGVPFEIFFPPLACALDEAEKNLGVCVNMIFSIIRTGGNTGWGHQTLDLIERYPHPRIVGIDLAGPECYETITPFESVYRRAKLLGLHRTAHSGEFCGPDHIRRTIQHLQVERIGHGITAAQDESLMQLLIEKDIPLEICPTSNVKLGAVASWESHPVRKLFDYGVPIVIGTDDPAFFGSTLEDEYRQLQRYFHFSEAEIEVLRRNVVRYRASGISDE
ncbi:MAG: adenosine deaminase [Planctomycetaceae bacterium]|nr:adenosine deaminase [Planctomycetaceae bacterium]